MRERICSSASSTVSIRRYSTPRCSTLEGPRSGVVEQGCAPLARALRAPNGAGELVTGVRQVDDGLELAEEPAPGEDEEREEPGRDREVAGAERDQPADDQHEPRQR